METLLPRIQACHRAVKDPLLINLTIETRAGVPTCVEHSRRKNERARCVAQVVAQHLQIPNSPDDEACDIRYPIRFAGDPLR